MKHSGTKACAMCEDADVATWCEQCKCYFCELCCEAVHEEGKKGHSFLPAAAHSRDLGRPSPPPEQQQLMPPPQQLRSNDYRPTSSSTTTANINVEQQRLSSSPPILVSSLGAPSTTLPSMSGFPAPAPPSQSAAARHRIPLTISNLQAMTPCPHTDKNNNNNNNNNRSPPSPVDDIRRNLVNGLGSGGDSSPPIHPRHMERVDPSKHRRLQDGLQHGVADRNNRAEKTKERTSKRISSSSSSNELENMSRGHSGGGAQQHLQQLHSASALGGDASHRSSSSSSSSANIVSLNGVSLNGVPAVRGADDVSPHPSSSTSWKHGEHHRDAEGRRHKDAKHDKGGGGGGGGAGERRRHTSPPVADSNIVGEVGTFFSPPPSIYHDDERMSAEARAKKSSGKSSRSATPASSYSSSSSSSSGRNKKGGRVVEEVGARMCGLGVKLRHSKNGQLSVAAIVPGGAAHSSGQINPGDAILAVGGVETIGKSLQDVASMFVGPESTPVVLTVLRNGSLPRSITLRRCVFDSAASPSSGGGSPGSRSGSDSSPGTHRLTEKPHTPPSPITGPPGTISPVKGGGGAGVDPVLRLLPVFVQMGTDVPPSPAKDAEEMLAAADAAAAAAAAASRSSRRRAGKERGTSPPAHRSTNASQRPSFYGDNTANLNFTIPLEVPPTETSSSPEALRTEKHSAYPRGSLTAPYASPHIESSHISAPPAATTPPETSPTPQHASPTHEAPTLPPLPVVFSPPPAPEAPIIPHPHKSREVPPNGEPSHCAPLDQRAPPRQHSGPFPATGLESSDKDNISNSTLQWLPPAPCPPVRKDPSPRPPPRVAANDWDVPGEEEAPPPPQRRLAPHVLAMLGDEVGHDDDDDDTVIDGGIPVGGAVVGGGVGGAAGAVFTKSSLEAVVEVAEEEEEEEEEDEKGGKSEGVGCSVTSQVQASSTAQSHAAANASVHHSASNASVHHSASNASVHHSASNASVHHSASNASVHHSLQAEAAQAPKRAPHILAPLDVTIAGPDHQQQQNQQQQQETSPAVLAAPTTTPSSGQDSTQSAPSPAQNAPASNSSTPPHSSTAANSTGTSPPSPHALSPPSPPAVHKETGPSVSAPAAAGGQSDVASNTAVQTPPAEMSGWLSKESHSMFVGAQKRWCVTKGGCLHYFHSELDSGPRESISLRAPTDISLDVSKSGGGVLVIAAKSKTYRFRHADKSILFEWLKSVTAHAKYTDGAISLPHTPRTAPSSNPSAGAREYSLAAGAVGVVHTAAATAL